MIELVKFSEDVEDLWEQLCLGSVNGTFLHSRRFLSYHGGRFKDSSFIVLNKGKPVGLIAAAESPGDPSTVISHPGLTYGGIVHNGNLNPALIAETFVRSAEVLLNRGVHFLVYKPIPFMYQQVPTEDDEYVLFNSASASIISANLNAVVCMWPEDNSTPIKRPNLKKATMPTIEVNNYDLLDNYYDVLIQNLDLRHGVAPIHSLDELRLLSGLFPGEIGLYFACEGDQVLGGIVVFKTPRCWHVQYTARSERGSVVEAVAYAVNRALSDARRSGATFLSLGISNDRLTSQLNDSLHSFKRKFGAGGVVQKTWKIDLCRLLEK